MSESSLGAMALIPAKRIDSGQESGGALATLVKALRQTMEAAVDAAPPTDDDPVTRLRRELVVE